jgi:hypothetical protein
MLDVTPAFREAVRRRRSALGLSTPVDEVLPRKKQPLSAFAAEARMAAQAIYTTAVQFREVNENSLDAAGSGLSEAELDMVDAETQQCLAACGDRLDALKQLALEQDASSGTQLAAHRQATMQLLYERLSLVAAAFGDKRGSRLRRAARERDQRLGAAAEAAGAFDEGGPLAPDGSGGGAAGGMRLGGALVGGALTGAVTGAVTGALGLGGRGLGDGGGTGSGHGGGGGSGSGGGHDGGESEALGWGGHEVLPDDGGLDEGTKAQLLSENEALQREFETMVDQAKEAEGRMLEIANLSHLFASKVEQQASTVEMLYANAEATSENLVRGNAYIDSASKHSRDFRLLVLTILLVATFALLFLDWYTP